MSGTVQSSDVLEVFRWFGRKEACDDIWWDEDLRVMVRCNDMFWWATADAEVITAADLPALEQAWKDLEDDDFGEVYAAALWVARKRGMRPQRPWWDREKLPAKVKDLFLAAGPERDRKDEG